MPDDATLDALEKTLTYIIEDTWWQITPPPRIQEGVRAELAALRELRAEVNRLTRETTRVQCAACGRLVRSRETAGGRCAGCLLRERDEARAEAGKARRELEILLWNRWLDTPDGRNYEAGWGDVANRERAERGKTWVAARMAEKGLGPGPGPGEGEGVGA